MRSCGSKVSLVCVGLLFLAAATLFVRWIWFSVDEQIWPLPAPPLSRAMAEAADDVALPKMIGDQMHEGVREHGSGGWRTLSEQQRTAWLVTRAQDVLLNMGALRFALAARQQAGCASLGDLATAYETMGSPAAAQLLRDAESASTQPPALAAMDAWLSRHDQNEPQNPLADHDAAIRTALATPAYIQQRCAWMRAHLDGLTGR